MEEEEDGDGDEGSSSVGEPLETQGHILTAAQISAHSTHHRNQEVSSRWECRATWRWARLHLRGNVGVCKTTSTVTPLLHCPLLLSQGGENMIRSILEEPCRLLSLSLNEIELPYSPSFNKGRACHPFSNPQRRGHLGDPFLWS